jgi:hypothetical protein
MEPGVCHEVARAEPAARHWFARHLAVPSCSRDVEMSSRICFIVATTVRCLTRHPFLTLFRRYCFGECSSEEGRYSTDQWVPRLSGPCHSCLLAQPVFHKKNSVYIRPEYNLASLVNALSI